MWGCSKLSLFCEFKEHVKIISIKQKKKLLGQNCPLQKSDDSFGKARQALPAALWFFLACDWDPCLLAQGMWALQVHYPGSLPKIQ